MSERARLCPVWSAVPLRPRLALADGDVSRTWVAATGAHPHEGSARAAAVADLANESANGSDENPLAKADTVRHEPDDRVAFALLRRHRSSSDITGRTALLTLSRWRHGFESRTGCQGRPGQTHSPECL